MTTYMIQALLDGPVDPAMARDVAAMLPLMLRNVERDDERAPDYHIDATGRSELGYGWSQLSPKAGIPYIAIIIIHPTGMQIAGVAFQSPDKDGRWIAQLHRVSEVKLHA